MWNCPTRRWRADETSTLRDRPSLVVDGSHGIRGWAVMGHGARSCKCRELPDLVLLHLTQRQCGGESGTELGGRWGRPRMSERSDTLMDGPTRESKSDSTGTLTGAQVL